MPSGQDECDSGWREGHDGTGHFPYFRPTSADIESLGIAISQEQLAGLADRLNADQRHVVDNVEEELVDAMEQAPDEALDGLGRLRASAAYVTYSVRWLGEEVDRANHFDGRSIDRLNEDFSTAKSHNFYVEWGDGERDTDVQVDQQIPAYQAAMDEARRDYIAELNAEWCRLDGLVEDRAAEVATMIDQGATADNVRKLFRNGQLPAEALGRFPNVPPESLTVDDWTAHLAASADRPREALMASTGGYPSPSAIPAQARDAVVNDPHVMTTIHGYLEEFARNHSGVDESAENLPYLEWTAAYTQYASSHPELHLTLSAHELLLLRSFVEDKMAYAEEAPGVLTDSARFEDEFGGVNAELLRALANESLGGSPDLLPEEISQVGVEEFLDGPAPPQSPLDRPIA